MDYWYFKYRRQNNCSKALQLQSKPIEFQIFKAHSLFMGTGVTFGLLVLMLENIHRVIRKRRSLLDHTN